MNLTLVIKTLDHKQNSLTAGIPIEQIQKRFAQTCVRKQEIWHFVAQKHLKIILEDLNTRTLEKLKSFD